MFVFGDEHGEARRQRRRCGGGGSSGGAAVAESPAVAVVTAAASSNVSVGGEDTRTADGGCRQSAVAIELCIGCCHRECRACHISVVGINCAL